MDEKSELIADIGSMKYAIGFLLFAFLFACNSSESLDELKILKQILVFESGFDSGKETKPRLVERKVYNEKGLLLTETAYEESGNVDYKNEYAYDSKDRKIKDTYFLENKCFSISEFIYKKNDSIQMIVVYKPDMKMDFAIQPYYNKKGFNYLDICRGSDNKILFWDTYERNGSGRLKTWTRFNPDSTIQSKVVYEYDKQGHEIKNTASGELGGTYLYKYNKKGLIKEEVAYGTTDHTFLWLKVFLYDRSNNLIKITEYNNLQDRPKKPYKLFNYKYEFW